MSIGCVMSGSPMARRAAGIAANAVFLHQLRAEHGLKLHAAIRKNVLYVATQDAGEGSDHFLYLAASLGAMHSAYAKARTAREVAEAGIAAGCEFDRNSELPCDIFTIKANEAKEAN